VTFLALEPMTAAIVWVADTVFPATLTETLELAGSAPSAS